VFELAAVPTVAAAVVDMVCIIREYEEYGGCDSLTVCDLLLHSAAAQC
jgi:hypothetical protein